MVLFGWHADENKLHFRSNVSIVCISRPLAALISQKQKFFISAGLVSITSVGFVWGLLVQRQFYLKILLSCLNNGVVLLLPVFGLR